MINKEKLAELVKEYPSMRAAAKDIGISLSGLSRLLSGERKGGARSLSIIAAFCRKKGRSVDDYIFLG